MNANPKIDLVFKKLFARLCLNYDLFDFCDCYDIENYSS